MADEIIVRLRGEGVDKFIREMKKAGLAVEDTGKKTKQAGTTFKGFGRTVGAAFTTAAIIQFSRVMVKLAVDIDATGKKLSTVFGKATKDVESFAKANATALGLTVNEYKRAAAAVGDLLIPIGFQRKEAAKLSNDLVKLSGALAAWTGGQLNATQVSEILTKALLGEREQLKQLGIQINEADISARLLEKGQKNLTGAALAQAKALAALELITEKSKDAQTAFADETVTLAEAQLQLRANIKLLAEELATALIPGLARATGSVVQFFEKFRKIREIRRGEVDYTSDLTSLTSDLLFARKADIEASIRQAKANQEGRIITKDYETQLVAVNAALTANTISSEELEDTIRLLNIQSRLQVGLTEEQGFLLDILIEKQKQLKEQTVIGADAQAGSIGDLTAKIKEQQDILTKAKPYSEEFFAANKEVKRLKLELDKLKKALEDPVPEGWLFEFFDMLEAMPAQINAIAGSIASDLEPVLLSTFQDIGDSLSIPENLDEMRTQAEKDNVEARLKFADMEKEEKIAAALEYQNTAGEIGQMGLDVTRGIFSAEQARLEEKYKQGLISQKEYERQSSEIRRKQAIADKAQAVFQATLNIANAVTKSFGQGGAVLGPAFAAISIAATTAQLAAILATPIPQFAKGTKGHRTAPEGFAWVGEEGPELVQMRGGEKVITAKDSEHMMKLLAGYGIPVQFQSTSERLNKPMRRFDKMMREAGVDIDWNPLLMSNERNRYSLGKKLDRIHMAILDTNQRKMTRA